MKYEDLEYIKNTIQFALDNGNSTDSDTESFYSCANNSINIIESELTIKEDEEPICPKCNGDGWYADHANHPHPDGDCLGECPVQVQCEQCCATGIINSKHDKD